MCVCVCVEEELVDVMEDVRSHLAIGRQWKSRSVLLLPHLYKEKVFADRSSSYSFLFVYFDRYIFLFIYFVYELLYIVASLPLLHIKLRSR